MPIFVKQIPLTDLEKQPENFRSTANIFKLPLSYQYGIGSAGFGAWRELATHIMTTKFLEYIPQNLQDWLSTQITKDDDIAASAITFVDENLKATNILLWKESKSSPYPAIHLDNILKNL